MAANNRADLSQFLVHLTKDGTFETYKLIPGTPPGYDVTYPSVVAKDSLIDIINTKKIEARSPFGYFKLKIDRYRRTTLRSYYNGGVDPNWIKAVCFSETPLRELRHFYKAVHIKRNLYRKYGLGFWQEKIRNYGGNPIFYVDDQNPNLIPALNSTLQQITQNFSPIMHLIDTFGPGVIQGAAKYADFRWEREWRKKDTLSFKFSDVAFGICSEDEIPQFEALVKKAFPFIDPDWSDTRLTAELTKKAPHLLPHL